MKTISRNTIYTNVVLAKDGTVWWEGGEGEPPAEGSDWQGRPWKPGMKDAKGKPVVGRPSQQPLHRPVDAMPLASRSARSTTTACRFRRSFSAAAGPRWPRWSTRRSTGSTACSSGPRWPRSGRPPSSASSARSAATRWPCCPSAATTWATTSSTGWTMGRRMANPPKIFHVNWFRTDENGKFLWPGYGENLRVIEWILDRCRGEADAVRDAHRLRAHAREPRPDRPGHPARIAGQALRRQPRPTGIDETERHRHASSSSSASGFPRALWDQLERLRQRLRPPLTLLKPGAEIRPLAAELNDAIERENPHVYAMLSELGQAALSSPRAFWPKAPRPRTRPSATTPRSASPAKTASRCSCPR